MTSSMSTLELVRHWSPSRSLESIQNWHRVWNMDLGNQIFRNLVEGSHERSDGVGMCYNDNGAFVGVNWQVLIE